MKMTGWMDIRQRPPSTGPGLQQLSTLFIFFFFLTMLMKMMMMMMMMMMMKMTGWLGIRQRPPFLLGTAATVHALHLLHLLDDDEDDDEHAECDDDEDDRLVGHSSASTFSSGDCSNCRRSLEEILSAFCNINDRSGQCGRILKSCCYKSLQTAATATF